MAFHYGHHRSYLSLFSHRHQAIEFFMTLNRPYHGAQFLYAHGKYQKFRQLFLCKPIHKAYYLIFHCLIYLEIHNRCGRD